MVETEDSNRFDELLVENPSSALIEGSVSNNVSPNNEPVMSTNSEIIDEDNDTDNKTDDTLEESDEEEETSEEDQPAITNEQVDATSLILQAVSLKEAGNDHFKSGNLTEASRSYRKGTSLLKNLNNQNTGDDQVKALLLSLQTNLSMVCLKQNKPKQSRDIASKALSVDSKNVKALYRRAVAHRKLGDIDNAKKDLKAALQYDPENVDVKRELAAIKRELDEQKSMEKSLLKKAFLKSGSTLSLYSDKEEEERKKQFEKKAKEEAEKEAKLKRKAEWEVENSKRISSGQEAISFEEWEKELKVKLEEEKKAAKKAKKENEEKKKKAENKSKESNHSDDEDEELTEKELQMFRGYKKTKDGRTTSYFTRETSSEDTIDLNVAPQRLPTTTSTKAISATICRSQSSSGDLTKKQGSAWNEAGTWEERDTSEWCTTTLRKYLLESLIDSTRYTAKVTEVSDLSGDASVAITRGKKCFLFDYHCKLQYDIMDSADDQIVASGSFNLPDISSTGVCDQLEVEILSWKKSPKVENIQEIISCRNDLIQTIRKQVNDFVGAFNREF